MKIGFCCKWLNDPSECRGMKINAKDRDLNGRSTTMRWLREHPEDAEQRQWDIMNDNAHAALKMVERVGSVPEERRMVRLGSEMLQGYTEPNWIDWWQQKDIQDHLAKIFAPVGDGLMSFICPDALKFKLIEFIPLRLSFSSPSNPPSAMLTISSLWAKPIAKDGVSISSQSSSEMRAGHTEMKTKF